MMGSKERAFGLLPTQLLQGRPLAPGQKTVRNVMMRSKSRSRQIQDELAQRNDGFWVLARHAAAMQAGVDPGSGGHFAV